jgi:amino acid adenylation domain-containing protein
VSAVAPGTADTVARLPCRLLAGLRAAAVREARAPALQDGSTRLDRAGLVAALDGAAARLRQAGVEAGDVVALPATRDAGTITDLLGVLACGAAYLPLDPDYPPARLAAMLEDARPRVLLASAAMRARLPASLAWCDREAPVRAAPREARDGSLAYVLFTSGSTGRPKGVAMRRAAVAGLLDWHASHARLGRAARTLQFAPLGFDVSFQEILSTLATGGTLVLAGEMERRDPYALLALMAREHIERVFLPGVALQALAEAAAAGGEPPRHLRDVVTAGEALRVTPALRAFFAALPGAVLHNHYGPTETHVVTAHELDGDAAAWPERPPIGRPLPHARVAVVDAALEPLPDGADGELMLGGDCLAEGYIHRPDLTAERFVLRGGARWYRTGDRARAEPDGTLACLGRLDDQLKVDGFRIEPAEIESVLLGHAAVAEAVVVAGEGAGGPQLVAHVVARDAQAQEDALATALEGHCRGLLADYLVPRRFVLHAALPLTASGKLDRRALAQPSAAPIEWAADATPEGQLLSLWRQLLDAPALGAADNVFEHGARSLLVVRALTELRRRGLVLRAVDVYEHPSPAAQARLLAQPAAASASAPGAGARASAQRAAFARFARGAGR